MARDSLKVGPAEGLGAQEEKNDDGEVSLKPSSDASSSSSSPTSPSPSPSPSSDYVGWAGPWNFSIGRYVENISRIYGMAAVQSGINVTFVLLVSILPLTKWNGDGVPRTDVSWWVAAFYPWCWVFFSTLVICNIGSFDPYPRPDERRSLVCAVPANVVAQLTIFLVATRS